MKKRDVILDFTSLLDVTLIVIFFFVIFTHFDTNENRKQVEEKENELNVAIEEVEAKEKAVNEKNSKLEEALEIAEESKKRLGENVEGIIKYENNLNIKFILDKNKNDWIVRVNYDSKTVSTEDINELNAATLAKIIENIGYKKDDTIFVDFVYDANLPGSRKAYTKAKNILNETNKIFGYFYCSETDLSIGKE